MYDVGICIAILNPISREADTKRSRIRSNLKIERLHYHLQWSPRTSDDSNGSRGFLTSCGIHKYGMLISG